MGARPTLAAGIPSLVPAVSFSGGFTMKIVISSNAEQVGRKFQDMARKQVNFAIARALSRTAVVVKAAEVREMKDVFDRPTPYALNAVYVKSATKQDLTARVWVKDDTSKGTPANKFLGPQIAGGLRGLKRFEKALRSKGFLPDGMIAVPASGAKLDAYGNMDRGQIVQMLAYLNAFGEEGYRANMTDKKRKAFRKRQSRAYFVGRPRDGKLPLGVWQRVNFAQGNALKPILLFVDAPRYESERFDFFYVAEITVKKTFKPELKASLEHAWATAR